MPNTISTSITIITARFFLIIVARTLFYVVLSDKMLSEWGNIVIKRPLNLSKSDQEKWSSLGWSLGINIKSLSLETPWSDD